jgi:hypothetical protein
LACSAARMTESLIQLLVTAAIFMLLRRAIAFRLIIQETPQLA